MEDLGCQILAHGKRALAEEVARKIDMVGATDVRLFGPDSGTVDLLIVVSVTWWPKQRSPSE